MGYCSPLLDIFSTSSIPFFYLSPIPVLFTIHISSCCRFKQNIWKYLLADVSTYEWNELFKLFVKNIANTDSFRVAVLISLKNSSCSSLLRQELLPQTDPPIRTSSFLLFPQMNSIWTCSINSIWESWVGIHFRVF